MSPDAEKGWTCVLETQVLGSDFDEAGLGQPVDGRASVDLVALSAYLNSRAGDRMGVVLDVWREIVREGDSWCVTMA